MSMLRLNLPESLLEGIRALAQKEGISINHFIERALAEKMSALREDAYLEERAQRGSREKYEAALAQVPDVPADSYDETVTRGIGGTASKGDKLAP